MSPRTRQLFHYAGAVAELYTPPITTVLAVFDQHGGADSRRASSGHLTETREVDSVTSSFFTLRFRKTRLSSVMVVSLSNNASFELHRRRRRHCYRWRTTGDGRQIITSRPCLMTASRWFVVAGADWRSPRHGLLLQGGQFQIQVEIATQQGVMLAAGLLV